jgi:3-hydroxyisobutyrate dehydrogenase-like beta-hydroxyacid dehydrogenase
VLLGKEGLVAGWGDGPKPVVVVMSTVSPEGIRELREQLDPEEIRLLDAPVSGGPILAEYGKLAVMVGGPEEEFARLRPVFEALGEKIYHVGPLGAGMAMKLVNNMIAITSMMIVPEAIALGVRHGLQVDPMVEIINASSGKTFITEHLAMFKAWMETALQKDDPFRTRDVLFTTGRKDLVTAQSWAAGKEFSTPVLDGVIEGLASMDQEFFLERIRTIIEQEKSP